MRYIDWSVGDPAWRNPTRHEPDLAPSLGVLGAHWREANRNREATEAFREGAELVRPYAERFPNGPADWLLTKLERDLLETEETGES